MSEKNILISTYQREDSILKLGAEVQFDNIEEIISVPESGYVNLYNYPLKSGENLKPRASQGNTFTISCKLLWEKGASGTDLQRLVEENERGYDVLSIRLQATSQNSKWCSSQTKISILDIGKDIKYDLEIPLNEIRNSVTLTADVIREKQLKNADTFKATETYTIVSSAELITIQVDEVKEIGGNYLPIKPEHIGDYVFELFGFEKDLQLPIIRYSEDLKEYFTNDDLITTNSTFFIGIAYFLDNYLKWLLFICKYDASDKNHKGLVELFSKYCNVSKAYLVETIEREKFCEEQVKAYYSLSLELFKGIQNNKDFNYKKQLTRLFLKEINLSKL